jgi:hypothetical protein
MRTASKIVNLKTCQGLKRYVWLGGGLVLASELASMELQLEITAGSAKELPKHDRRIHPAQVLG